MQHSVCTPGSAALDLRQLALEDLLDHSFGVIVETPRRTLIQEELELIRLAKEGGTSDFLEGALRAIQWISKGGPAPHDILKGLLS